MAYEQLSSYNDMSRKYIFYYFRRYENNSFDILIAAEDDLYKSGQTNGEKLDIPEWLYLDLAEGSRFRSGR